MAEVWLAESVGPSGFVKRVALKTMLPHVARTPEFVKMFINEASVAAQLAHENIAQVFDFGELEGHYFLAMEYVQGRTLRQIGRRHRELGRPVDPWFLARAMLDVCNALEYVHTLCDIEGEPMGLVHRDVSPENVLVSFTGAIKLVDFGVASVGQSHGPSQKGMLVGKCRYMAPERIAAPRGMPQSDLFSVGAILYEFATGCFPFLGEDETALLMRILEGKPRPPRMLVPSLPEELEAIILKALSTKPVDRQSSAAELAQDLRTFLEHHDRTGLHRPLDAHMGNLFSEVQEIPSYVRVAAARALANANEPIIDVFIEDLHDLHAKDAKDDGAPDLEPEKTRPSPKPGDAEPSSILGSVTEDAQPAPSYARLATPASTVDSAHPRPFLSATPFQDAGPEEPPPPRDSLQPSSRLSPLFGPDSRTSSLHPGAHKDVFSLAPTSRSIAPRGLFYDSRPDENVRTSDILHEWGILRTQEPPNDASSHKDESTHEGTSTREDAIGDGGRTSGRAFMPAPPGADAAAQAFDRALRHIAGKDYAAAVEALRQAVELAPNNRTYRTNLKRLEAKLEHGSSRS